MMSVNIICVGKLKESYLREGCAEYAKRLGAYCKANIIEVAEERASDNPKETEIAQILRTAHCQNPQGQRGCAALH